MAEPTLEPDEVDSRVQAHKQSFRCLSHHFLSADLVLFPVKWAAGPASLEALFQEIVPETPTVIWLLVIGDGLCLSLLL